MRQVERSALVPFPAEAMFDLVADVESYPAFVPGCTGSRVHSRGEQCLVASLALAEGPLHTELRTRNRLERPRLMDMQLEEGPFSTLHGVWEFTPLGEHGSKVALSIRFAFSSKAVDLLMGPVFEAICNRLVEAFVRRARSLYG